MFLLFHVGLNGRKSTGSGKGKHNGRKGFNAPLKGRVGVTNLRCQMGIVMVNESLNDNSGTCGNGAKQSSDGDLPKVFWGT